MSKPTKPKSINLPAIAGLGLKPEHYHEAMACDTDRIWFEVHPENYMVDGGPRLAWLGGFSEKFALSFHGIGLSLGGLDRPDRQHLSRLKSLVDRFNPVQVSEHLAWSRLGDVYFADLLPPPATKSSLDRLVDHIDETQEFLNRKLLIENPSLYLPIPGFAELPQLYVEAARRSGAELLFDLNNIAVCAANVLLPTDRWLDVVPAEMVKEIHLAGATARKISGETVMIDSHDAPVSDQVWQLLEQFIAANGARPVLIERDGNIPGFSELMAEHERAASILSGAVAANG